MNFRCVPFLFPYSNLYIVQKHEFGTQYELSMSSMPQLPFFGYKYSKIAFAAGARRRLRLQEQDCSQGNKWGCVPR